MTSIIVAPPSINFTGISSYSTSRKRRPEKDRELEFLSARQVLESPAQTVLQAFSVLNAAASKAQTNRNTVTYGPYNISGNCSYDCGFMDFNWSWAPNYNSWATFNSDIARYTSLLPVYNNAFAPAALLLQNLNNHNTQFKDNLGTIKSIDLAIKNAGGTITPEQELKLTQSFDALLNTIGTVKSECNGAISNFSAFVNNSNYLVNYLPTRLSQTTSSIVANVTTNRDNLIGEAPCGSGTITDRFNGISSAATAASNAITPSFVDVGKATQKALNAVSSLVGKMLIVQADYDLVSGDVSRAKSLSPVDVMREVALIEADDSWILLVTATQETLAT